MSSLTLTSDFVQPIFSATHLQTILEAAPVAMVMVDARGPIVFVNREAEQLFGYSRDELLGQSVEMLAPEASRHRLSEWQQLLLAEPRSRHLGANHDLLGLRKDGRQVPLKISLTPLHTDEGTFVLATLDDISEWKHAQDVIRNEEERLRAMLTAALDAVIMIDDQGRVTEWNPQAESLFGWSAEEAIGQSLDTLIIPPQYQEAHRRGLQIFRETGFSLILNKRIEMPALRRTGEEFPVELAVAPIRRPHGYEFSAFIRDLTERHRLETRFRAMIESAPMAMLLTDQQGTIQMINAQTEAMFGYPREELLGQGVEILFPERFREQHPHLRREFFIHPQEQRLGGVGSNLLGLRKDGTEFPLEWGLGPIDTDEGPCVLSAIVDITERQKMNDVIKASNETLEQRVNERTAELLHSNLALERSNLDLQQFAYIASHDLQTPLRGIVGFAQLLQRNYQGKLDEQADGWISRMVESALRMHQLIQDLLSYSAVDSRARAFEPVNMSELVAETVRVLEPAIVETNTRVEWDDLPTILGDRSQLAQLLQNLIGNAIKYHHVEPPRVRVTAERTSREWIFAVRDNGIGIDPKHHDRIFEIFRRLHTQQAYPGTGIGLAVCRRVVHRHGGRIWVESELGRGSVFYFTIPERRVEDL